VSTLYDRIGTTYRATRRSDARLAALLAAALGDARTILNIGAGTGSYEPRDRDVLGVEPSPTMIGQRPPGAAPAVQASVEDMPLPDHSYDAARTWELHKRFHTWRTLEIVQMKSKTKAAICAAFAEPSD
jgi:hypothetical protein